MQDGGNRMRDSSVQQRPKDTMIGDWSPIQYADSMPFNPLDKTMPGGFIGPMLGMKGSNPMLGMKGSNSPEFGSLPMLRDGPQKPSRFGGRFEGSRIKRRKKQEQPIEADLPMMQNPFKGMY